MVSKSTSILLAVAVVAVSAVAIIGLGYAYTASTENSGNTTTSKYITLNQATYADNFDGRITYSTSNNGTNVTYTLDGAVELGDSGTSGVLLGSTTVQVVRTNANETFKFSVSKFSGDMTGTFWIGIQVQGSDEQFRPFTVGSENYYHLYVNNDEIAKHAAVTDAGNADAISNSPDITVKFYITGLNSATTAPTEVQPLNNVTFKFTATSVAAS